MTPSEPPLTAGGLCGRRSCTSAGVWSNHRSPPPPPLSPPWKCCLLSRSRCFGSEGMR
ncbi:hypothetical protein HanRHA438_Chr16g0784581 [Helianthus annuus]|nr:hypothetical protein HanRHA438_Chr16g0784581 [Helianthus annuus]